VSDLQSQKLSQEDEAKELLKERNSLQESLQRKSQIFESAMELQLLQAKQKLEHSDEAGSKQRRKRLMISGVNKKMPRKSRQKKKPGISKNLSNKPQQQCQQWRRLQMQKNRLLFWKRYCSRRDAVETRIYIRRPKNGNGRIASFNLGDQMRTRWSPSICQ
jgi:hypothetical protein